jgi:hypothetical protein
VKRRTFIGLSAATAALPVLAGVPRRMPVDADLSYTALEDAATHLPRGLWYTLFVHPKMARQAAKVIGEHGRTLESNPLSRPVVLRIDHMMVDEDGWRLEVGGEAVYSPGCC